MYTINFFMLRALDEDKYLEDIKEYELILSSLKDVKSFLDSEFYENVYEHLFAHLHGIVITKDKEVIYKELFDSSVTYEIYKDDANNITIYKEIGTNENDDCYYIIVNKLDEVVE